MFQASFSSGALGSAVLVSTSVIEGLEPREDTESRISSAKETRLRALGGLGGLAWGSVGSLPKSQVGTCHRVRVWPCNRSKEGRFSLCDIPLFQ